MNRYTDLIKCWNETLKVVASFCQVPAALVMKIDADDITVFSKNESQTNPYQFDDREVLNGSGLYCEQVIKSQTSLEVNNALKDPKWSENPDIKLNMIAYLGLPLVDADDTPFGTLCILDNKEHNFSDDVLSFLCSIKQGFEAQLKQLSTQHLEDEKQYYKELLDFTSGIAHEINTPLSISITAVSVIEHQIALLKQQATLHSSEKFLSKLQESASLLTCSLSSIAEKVSHLQDSYLNETTGQLTQCNVVKLCQQVLSIHEKNKLTERGVHCVIECKALTQRQLSTYPNLLRQVLITLIENSLIHGFKEVNNPEIRLKLVNTVNHLQIHYYDNGVGISSENYNKIFIPYFTTQRSTGNAGLGLSIVKKIISLQLDGEIQLQPSTSGVHFVMKIPLHK